MYITLLSCPGQLYKAESVKYGFCKLCKATSHHSTFTIQDLSIQFQTFPSKDILKTWMESISIFKGTAHKEANYSIVEIGAFLCDFYEQESVGEKVGGCQALFLGSAAARVERSGLTVEEWNLWDRMGGKLGSDFSLTGGKRGPDWYLGIYEDSLKAART